MTVDRTFENRRQGQPDDSPLALEEHKRRADALHSALDGQRSWSVADYGDTDDDQAHESVHVVLDVAGGIDDRALLRLGGHVLMETSAPVAAALTRLIDALARRQQDALLGHTMLALPDGWSVWFDRDSEAPGHSIVSVSRSITLPTQDTP